MDIYIARGDSKLGPYSEEQVRQMLSSGQLAPADLAWHSDLAGWVPLHQVLGGPAPATAAAGNSKSTATLLIIVSTVVGGFMLLMCGGVLLGLLLPAVQAAREAARRMQCSNNLKQIALAMHNYHDTYQSFPPAYFPDEQGRPMHSWRVMLLPFLEQQELYDQYDFDQPWDSPANQAVTSTPLSVYMCPSSPNVNAPNTRYLAVAGPGTLFEADTSTAYRDVLVGLSNTIMIAEVRDREVPWAAPIDYDVSRMTFQVNGGPEEISSYHPGGANVAMGDGAVRFFSNTTDAEVLRTQMRKVPE